MNDFRITIARRQLIGLMITLALEYIVGVSLTTIVNYTPGVHTNPQRILLDLHILVGVGLLVGGAIRLAMAYKWKWLRMWSTIGFVSLIGAFGAGEAAADHGASGAVFVMALLFLVAFVSYGASFMTLRSLKSKS